MVWMVHVTFPLRFFPLEVFLFLVFHGALFSGIRTLVSVMCKLTKNIK